MITLFIVNKNKTEVVELYSGTASIFHVCSIIDKRTDNK